MCCLMNLCMRLQMSLLFLLIFCIAISHFHRIRVHDSVKTFSTKLEKNSRDSAFQERINALFEADELIFNILLIMAKLTDRCICALHDLFVILCRPHTASLTHDRIQNVHIKTAGSRYVPLQLFDHFFVFHYTWQDRNRRKL